MFFFFFFFCFVLGFWLCDCVCGSCCLATELNILNAMHLASSTKALIQKLRDDGWDGLLTTVISFCEKHRIDILDMNARYVARRG